MSDFNQFNQMQQDQQRQIQEQQQRDLQQQFQEQQQRDLEQQRQFQEQQQRDLQQQFQEQMQRDLLQEQMQRDLLQEQVQQNQDQQRQFQDQQRQFQAQVQQDQLQAQVRRDQQVDKQNQLSQGQMHGNIPSPQEAYRDVEDLFIVASDLLGEIADPTDPAAVRAAVRAAVNTATEHVYGSDWDKMPKHGDEGFQDGPRWLGVRVPRYRIGSVEGWVFGIVRLISYFVPWLGGMFRRWEDRYMYSMYDREPGGAYDFRTGPNRFLFDRWEQRYQIIKQVVINTEEVLFQKTLQRQ